MTTGQRVLLGIALVGTAGLAWWLWSKRGRMLGDAALDREMARKSLREEREAIHAYSERLHRAEDPRLKKVLRHARKEERQHAAMFQPLTGPSMLKTIADESRSPEEFARRAEAWASAEAKPPTDKELALEYWRASGGITRIGAMMKMIREAKKRRLSQTEARWKGYMAQPDDEDERAES